MVEFKSMLLAGPPNESQRRLCQERIGPAASGQKLNPPPPSYPVYRPHLPSSSPEFGEDVAESSDSSAAPSAPVRLMLRGWLGKSLGMKGKGGKEGKGKCWAFPSVPCEFMLWSADAASLPADMPPSLVPASNKDILRRKIISLGTVRME